MKIILNSLVCILFNFAYATQDFDAVKVAENLNSIEQWNQLTVNEQEQVYNKFTTSNKYLQEWESEKSYYLNQFEDLTSEIPMGAYVSTDGSTLIKQETVLSKEQVALIVQNFKLKFSEAISEFEVDGENVTSYGEPSVSVSVFMIGEDILTVRYNLSQDGAYNEDESYGPHFESEEEAMAAGWDTGADVSWYNYFVLNHKGDLLESNGYWEWAGW